MDTRLKITLISGAIITLVVVVFLLLIPQILKIIGLHPDYDRIEYNLPNKKALMVTTSHSILGESIEDTEGAATGVFASELTIAYYEFIDAGLKVDIASVKGGEIPFEPASLQYPLKSHQDDRYLADKEALAKTSNSLKVDDVDFTEYDVVWFAGGWGAAYDLGTSKVIGQKVTKANAEGVILAAVCHGVLALLQAEEVDGRPLVEGKTITGVTDKQVQELRIDITPQHPEEELRKLNANFVANTAFRDFFATYTAIDGSIVTGQNQNSSGETAQTALKLLSEQN